MHDPRQLCEEGDILSPHKHYLLLMKCKTVVATAGKLTDELRWNEIRDVQIVEELYRPRTRKGIYNYLTGNITRKVMAILSSVEDLGSG